MRLRVFCLHCVDRHPIGDQFDMGIINRDVPILYEGDKTATLRQWAVWRRNNQTVLVTCPETGRQESMRPQGVTA